MSNRNNHLLISSITAGMCIGVGGIACLAVDNRIAGAFLFAIGLFTICTFRLHLFTGKVSRVGCKDGLSNLSILAVWFGNLIGAFAVAGMVLLTHVGEAISRKAAVLCQAKLADNMVSLFVLGMFCNAMIYIAVELFAGLDDSVGKYLAIVFGVMVFILSGFEHSVADMFYLAAGRYILEPRAWLCVGVVTLGNACGGVLCNRVRRYLNV